jgi:hypothetical protein
MSIPASFTVRSTIGINGPQVNYFSVQDKFIVLTGPQNASIFVISQINNQNNTFYHQIRYGHSYVGTENINGLQRLILQQQPYNWYFITTTSTTPTYSTVDLLDPVQPFIISNIAGFGISVTSSNVLGLLTVKKIIELSRLISLGIKSGSQPVIDQIRVIDSLINSPAPSFAPVLLNGAAGNITINGFEAGVYGQRLTVISQSGNSITVNDLSPLVASAEQIITPAGGTEISPANGSFDFIYDGAKWRLLTQQSMSGGTSFSLADGSAVAPSLNFISDLTTGVFHSGTPNDYVWRFANNGVETINISPNGITPATDDLYNLGVSGSNEYKAVYTRKLASEIADLNIESGTGDIIVNSFNFKPLVDNTVNLGTSAARWTNVFTSSVSANTGNLILNGAAVIPNADDTVNLGLSGSRWLNTYTSAISSGNHDLIVNPFLNFKPGVDITYNLGSASNRWLNVNTTGINSGATDLTISGAGAVIPGAAGKNIGSNAASWGNIYTSGITTDSLSAFTATNMILTTAAGGGLIPNLNNQNNLGISGTIWNTIYTGKIEPATDLTIGLSGYSVIPQFNNSENLGAPGNTWANIHTNNMYISGITARPVFENGTLSPTLVATTTAITNGSITYNGSWTRVHKNITAAASIVWSGITQGTGALVINNGIPLTYLPSISGIPGSITYYALSGITNTLQVMADVGAAGRLSLRVTDSAGNISPYLATGMSSTGYLIYSMTYETL